MVQRRYLITLLLFSAISRESLANAWITPDGEYNIGIHTSALTEICNGSLSDTAEYIKISKKLDYVKRKKIEIEYSNIPKEVKQRRISELDKLFDVLEAQQKNLNTSFNKYSTNFYLERGIGTSKSIGFKTSNSRKYEFGEETQNPMNLEIFYKKKWYNKKNWVITPAFGINIDDFRKSTFMPYFGISIAYVKHLKSNRKFISELNFTNYFDKEPHVSSTTSQTLEFANKISLQFLEFQSYNKNIGYAYRYYYKDQFSVAKQFSSSNIPIFRNSIISSGYYQEYFGSKKKSLARGVFAGLWLKL